MDQAYRQDHDRLLAAAAPILRQFPDNIWLTHRIIRLPDGRIDKPPAPGFRTNDPRSWCSLAQAIEEAERYPAGTAGIGFVIADGLVTFDFDGCVDANGEVVAEIATLITRLDSFGHTTVSGTGRRVVCLNDPDDPITPGKYTRRTADGHNVEIFVGPTNFYNTLGADTDGKAIRQRASVVRTLLDELHGSGGGGSTGDGTAGGNLGEIGRTSDLGKRARDLAALFDALQAIPNDNTVDRNEWARIGEAVYAATDGSEDGHEAFFAWSKTWVDYDTAPADHAENTSKLWDSFHGSPPRTIGAGTVFHLAKQHGWKWPEDPLTPDTGSDDTEAETETPPPKLSEAALARRFARRHRNRLRFVQKWGQWRWWTGTVCQEDTTQKTLNEARLFCQEMAMTSNRSAQARSLTKVSTARAVLAFAAATPDLAATVEQWDADPWLLNMPDDVVDLRSGRIRSHRAEDYMTKITAVSLNRKHSCPRWLRFLDEITGGDQALVNYLQRVCGYCLTGSIGEHALFFAHGSGANGKSTFCNLLTWIMGSYAAVAPMETFTAHHGDAHPTELARLQGARLVVAQEIEDGRAWAESRIKALTGGDPITARFMRQDFFTYGPQFKLFLCGNHKPRLRNVDAATRRRFHLIPFTVQIPKARQDPNLLDKLKAEGPGILAWMMDGNTAWKERGLDPPQVVLDATEDYLNTEDTIGNWLVECCETGCGLSEATGRLYTSHETWMRHAGEHPPSQRRFVQELTSRGFVKQTWIDHTKPKAIDGLRLKAGLQGGGDL